MALMRRYIDKRTIASLAADGTATYAHGLPGTPDTVTFRFVAAVTATALHKHLVAVIDATNVTIDNAGGGVTGDFEVCAICFHSMIQ